MITVRAKIDETVLDDAARKRLTAALRALERFGATVVYPKPPKPPEAPKALQEPKPIRPKMTPSERGRAGARGLWGTPDNPKRPTRRPRRRKPEHLKKINPKMREVWNALPEDGSFILIDALAEKIGIPAMNTRAALSLLKKRGFAAPRRSDRFFGKTGQRLVEWGRTVGELPNI